MKIVDLSKGEHKTESFLKVNPRGQIPALSDGEFNLNESISISRYLIQSRASSTDFYPYEDAKKVAKINALIDHDTMTFRSKISPLVYKTVIMPLFYKSPFPTAEELEKLQTESHASFESLNNLLTTSGGPYLFGESLTLADLTHYFVLVGPVYFADDTTIEKFPEVHEWFKKVGEEPSVAETTENYKKTWEPLKEMIAKIKEGGQ